MRKSKDDVLSVRVLKGNGEDGDTARGKALVITSTPVTSIVVMRIAERIGLKALSVSPSDAAKSCEQLQPVIVIVEEEACRARGRDLLDSIAGDRDGMAERTPKVVLLSTGAEHAHARADAVVAMPVTTDALQPVLHRLVFGDEE